MKHRLLGLMFVLILVAASGYLGFRGDALTNQQLPFQTWLSSLDLGTTTAAAESAPTPPPTVLVERGTVEETVIAPGELSGVQERILSASVSGTINELAVKPGERVTAGQIIAQLDPRSYEEALEQANIKLAQAQTELEEQIANAELAVRTAETSVTGAQANYPSLTAAEVRLEQARQAEANAQYEYQKAQDRPWEPESVVESYRLQYEAAVDNRKIAEADYDSVQNKRWGTSQDVAAAEIGLEQAQLELEALREAGIDPLLQWAAEKARADLEATSIVAPFDGVVLEVEVRPGENVSAGEPLMVIADVRQGEIKTSVIEEDLPLIEPGQTAEIYFDAVVESVIKGTVDRIVPQRTDAERPLYPVYIAVDDLTDGLLPGMTADAVIVINRRENVIRLPRAVLRADEGNTATVEIWNGHEVEKREVELGLRGDVYVEVLSGVEVGEQVVGQ